MKKLIKVTSVILSAAMVFSMAACGKKVDPKEVFDAAVKKNSEMTSMDMNTTTQMKITQGEESIDMTVDMAMKMAGLNTEGMKYYAETKTSMMGQNIDMTLFYTDGYYYMDAMGQKVKYPMDLTAIMESVKKSTESTNLSSDQMKDVQLKAEGDNQILTFTGDPEKMSTYINDMMASMGQAASNLEGVEMTIKEVNGTYTVNKDGYYTDMTMKMVLDMTMQGETVSMEMDVTGKINNPGQEVAVELPDTEGYQEIDPALLGITG